MNKNYVIGLFCIAFFTFNCNNNKTIKTEKKGDASEKVIEQEEKLIANSDSLIIKAEIDQENASEIIVEKERVSNEIKSQKSTNEIVEVEIENNLDIPKNDDGIEEVEIVPTEEVAIEEIASEQIKEEEDVPEKIEQSEESQTLLGTTVTDSATSSNEWIVPTKYQTLKNPTNPKVDLSIGKSLYSKHCKSCHGKEGYGDGPKAEEQDGDLGDFSTEDFQAQTDGALFYKTTFGRDDMPEYTKKMPDDEDRWLIVNYMRTLAE